MTFNAGIEAAALKPCPFCGGEAVIEQKGSTRQSNIVACTECGCRLESGDVFDPAGSWNTRPSSPSDPAQEPQAVADWQVRLGASEYACYRWPDDTAEHRAMRAAFCDGASHAHTRPVSLDREALARIIDPAAKFDDIDGVKWSIADIERRNLAYQKADAILAKIEGRT